VPWPARAARYVADDTDTVTFTFDVEDDASDGSAEFEIRVEGIDDHGSRMGEVIRIRLDIERKRHEIAIKEITLTPESLTCAKIDKRSILSVRVRILNIGRDDEEEVSLEAKIIGLDVGQITRDIELDEDDDDTFNFNLNLPANIEAATYEVLVSSFYNRDELSNRDNALLTVPDCSPTDTGFQPPVVDPTDKSKSDEIVVTTTPTTTADTLTPPTSVSRGATSNSSFGSLGKGSTYVMVLLGVIVVLILIGVGLIVAISKKGGNKGNEEQF